MVLKYELRRNGKWVSFFVIEQDEKRKSNTDANLKYSYNGFSIRSFRYIELDDDIIYIRGVNPINEDKIVTKWFNTVEEAQSYVRKAREALESLKINGFNTVEIPTENKDDSSFKEYN